MTRPGGRAAALAGPPLMTKDEAIGAVIAASGEAPVVFTTGYACRIANALGDRPNHLYMTGSMGLAAPVATGIALATGRPAVVVDGDGSLLMNPAALVTAGSLGPVPLVHVLLDDGVYASTGGQPTGSEQVDLCGYARASGYRVVTGAADAETLAAFVRRYLSEPAGPVFVRCPLAPSGETAHGRVPTDLAHLADRFHDHLRDRPVTAGIDDRPVTAGIDDRPVTAGLEGDPHLVQP